MKNNPSDFRNIGENIAKIYEQAEQYILSDIAARIDMGEDIPDAHWRRRVLKASKEARNYVKTLLGDIDGEVRENAYNALESVYREGVSASPDGAGVSAGSGAVLNPAQMPLAMAALAADAANRITAPHSNILRRVDDAYREIQGQTTAAAMARGLTRVQASQQFLNNLADRGLTSFIDKAGRQWDMSSYAEMAMRTNAAHFYRGGLP